ncbi:MAG: hypothetical protein ACRERV_08545, partial [Methylococcales bacterium]
MVSMIGGALAMNENDENELPERKFSVLFGQTEIIYSVNYADRKTLAIHVYPDSQVLVDAPISASNDAIAKKVKKK